MDIFYLIDDELEDDIVLDYLNPSRRLRIVRERPDNMSVWDDKEFHRRFRLEKSTVQFLQAASFSLLFTASVFLFSIIVR